MGPLTAPSSVLQTSLALAYTICRLCADSLGNSLDIHAGLLLVGIKVDPIAREDDIGVYLRAGEAGDRGNATAGCGLRIGAR